MAHQLTKDDIKLIIRNWESKSTQEIADIIGCSPYTVTNTAVDLRKLGAKISKKRSKGYLQALIKEVIAEL